MEGSLNDTNNNNNSNNSEKTQVQKTSTESYRRREENVVYKNKNQLNAISICEWQWQ